MRLCMLPAALFLALTPYEAAVLRMLPASLKLQRMLLSPTPAREAILKGSMQGSSKGFRSPSLPVTSMVGLAVDDGLSSLEDEVAHLSHQINMPVPDKC